MGCPLPGCVREVTDEPAFSGGRLAQLSVEDARVWVHDVLRRAQEDKR
jgi:hypothetical protein